MDSAIALPPRPIQSAGDAYLKFRLNAQTPAVFSMRSVQEAMVLPTRRLTPMPNLPPAMMGLMNRRSRVIWVVDLGQLLELSTLDFNAQQHSIILIQVGAVPLGLAVQQVEGMVRLDSSQIQSPIGQVSKALVPYLRGCALQPAEKPEMLLILDTEAIIQAPVLRHHA
ncbi:MAG: chemotaxis protein CheW [Pegethrix bostrychoides GSE-TBD4-15B]|jgi:twitching motility protein PilI|uniref:Chemotaxis protein CheW n=1 Tax=Pegethrix bostrychoides GSE-TBD4-15B TaxID=2839662 RepID=A0A951PES5_9CYAN|nr:chemotaxis protein CheW [Pegethrix bostrychoides GSE-TBD4-15B]